MVALVKNVQKDHYLMLKEQLAYATAIKYFLLIVSLALYVQPTLSPNLIKLNVFVTMDL